nr:reverse transcriptase domain-containing protein [Tanacetum cinerariifolium]
MLLNLDQLEKQLDKEEFQEDRSMAAFWVINKQFHMFIDSQFTCDYDNQMTEKYFDEYTRIKVKQLGKHYSNTWSKEGKVDSSKALDASLVVTECNTVESENSNSEHAFNESVNESSRIDTGKQDTSSSSENYVTHTVDADIRPANDQVPFAEIQLTAQHNPHIPYPLRLNKHKLQDKSDIQIHKFLQMFKKLHFNISFVEALAHMPKYAKMFKDLFSNKEKLLELDNTPLNENFSMVLLKKLPKKLRDPGKFLIPYDFSELEEYMALADLGSSINLMPLSGWKKLILPELVPTRMILKLANQLVAYPAGIAEDVFVQESKFTFPADFIVVDYDADPRVPLILEGAFLRTARALVDVHKEELTLRVGDEKLVFNVESTSKYPHKHEDNPTPSSDPVVASLSPSLTPFGDSDFLLEEIDALLALDDLIPLEIDEGIFDPEGDILLLEKLLNNDSTKDLPPKELKNDETKMTKSSIEEPPNLELKDLPPHL